MLAPGRVGRDGTLRLGFERRGTRTVLTERRFMLPLQVLDAVDLDGSGVAVMTLLNPSGGVLGGDALSTTVTLGPRSHACLTTPAATRVYRSLGPPAVLTFEAFVGEEAVLEYVPDHLIPSPAARLHQRTRLVLAPGATLILVDGWAVGRAARGEAWQFDELDSALTVRDDRGVLLAERVVLDRTRRWDGLGGTEGCSYVGTVVAAAPSADGWDEMASELATLVAGLDVGARVAITPLTRGGLLARLLCGSAPALQASVHALWGASRRRLLGLPPLALRKL